MSKEQVFEQLKALGLNEEEIKALLEDGTYDRARVEIAVAVFLRLRRVLYAAFGGKVFVPSDGAAYLYAHLRQAFYNALNEPCLQSLREALPKEALPESLYPTDLECFDIDWEYTILPALNAFTGKVMNFCAERGIDPYDDTTEAVMRELGYDGAIASYEALRKRVERRVLERLGLLPAEAAKQEEQGKQAEERKGAVEPVLAEPDGARRGAPPLEERIDAEAKREAAREYLALRRKGVKAEVAADRVGYSKRTLDGWVERFKLNGG